MEQLLLTEAQGALDSLLPPFGPVSDVVRTLAFHPIAGHSQLRSCRDQPLHLPPGRLQSGPDGVERQKFMHGLGSGLELGGARPNSQPLRDPSTL